MDKKYTVFISSTYADLKDERQKVLDNVLQMECIPVGMEYFPAADDEQFNIIKKLIDDCDFYVLIIGGRYGSIHPLNGISYTEMEYDYAVEQKIPVLVFEHKDIASISDEKKDNDPNIIAKLNDFKEKARGNRMARMWSTHDELVSGVIISLNNAKKSYDRPGWVRDGADTTNLLLQNNNLQQEKEKLTGELQAANSEIKELKKMDFDLAFENEKVTINYSYSVKDGGYGSHSSTTKYGKKETTLKEIFKRVSIHMLGISLSKVPIEEIIKDMTGSKYSHYLYDIDFLDKILNQFIALGLMTAHYNNKTQYFGLTKKGEKLKNELNLIKKGEKL